MTVLAKPLAILATIAIVFSAVIFGGTAIMVDRATCPDRPGSSSEDLRTLLEQFESVSFVASDGVPLSGWLMRGRQGRPAIVIGHAYGDDKSISTGLARRLNDEGFTLLLLDFRGHGDSGGTRSTLGVHEKRDVLAAVELLRQSVLGPEKVPIGVYGVGMGAHAAVLAAAENPWIKVLVLDGLYPDVGYALNAAMFPNWPFGRDRLGFVPASVLRMITQADVRQERAADVLDGLMGRELLLLASEQDPDLGAEMKRMYHTIPVQRDVDGNLVLLAATQPDGLYGDALTAYHDRVTNYFLGRLRSPSGS